MKNGLLHAYPRLEADLTTEVIVMGGGISGALVAWHLSRAGIPVVALDRRHIGMGSTAGSTALLQYEIDTPLVELKELVGEEAAVSSYRLCVEAIGHLEALSRSLGVNSFRHRPSLYYASLKKDVAGLEREYAERNKHGIGVEWWDAGRISSHFPLLRAGAALWTETAAEVDSVELTHALFQDSLRLGARVFDCTEVTDIRHLSRSVELRTEDERVIKAKRLVIACGYESQNFLSRTFIRLHSTYAIASKPLPQEAIWYRRALVWESARPYLYARTTDDHRVIAGGKDEPFYSPARRDRLLNRKSRQLEAALGKKLLGRSFPTDFRWTGTFAETKDGLPYIGQVPERPHTWFVLGVGGNGIVFSIIAARLLRDTFSGKKPEAAPTLFSFDR